MSGLLTVSGKISKLGLGFGKQFNKLIGNFRCYVGSALTISGKISKIIERFFKFLSLGLGPGKQFNKLIGNFSFIQPKPGTRSDNLVSSIPEIKLTSYCRVCNTVSGKISKVVGRFVKFPSLGWSLGNNLTS